MGNFFYFLAWNFQFEKMMQKIPKKFFSFYDRYQKRFYFIFMAHISHATQLKNQIDRKPLNKSIKKFFEITHQIDFKMKISCATFSKSKQTLWTNQRTSVSRARVNLIGCLDWDLSWEVFWVSYWDQHVRKVWNSTFLRKIVLEQNEGKSQNED